MDSSEENICPCCGNDNQVVVASMILEKDKYVVYRKSGVEVTFKLVDGLIRQKSHPLSIRETNYILNHIIRK